MQPWHPDVDRRRLECVHVGRIEIREGDRVRLRPQGRRDILDLVLAGKTARVEAVEEDFEGRIYLAVTIDDDPGRDLGEIRQPGHRFFFLADEVEPLEDEAHNSDSDTQNQPGPPMDNPRILVAGIGNIFFGDDAFGVEVVQRLTRRKLPHEVRVVDFGIRGIDLTYALLDGYETVILVDAISREGPPGTLYLLEADPDESAPNSPTPGVIEQLEAHGMVPAKVLRVAASMGAPVRRVLLVGCEPARLDEEGVLELSPPVCAAVDEAVQLIESLLEKLIAGEALAHSVIEGK